MCKEEMHEKAVRGVYLLHSGSEEEKLEGWEICLELYWHFEPTIKNMLNNPRQIKVEPTLWENTVFNEGYEELLAECRVQFYELLYQFDPTKKVYFIHYMNIKLAYGVFNYLKKGQSFDRTIKDDSFDYGQEGYKGESGDRSSKNKLQDLQRVECEMVFPVEQKKSKKELRVNAVWETLTPKQKIVVDLTIYRNYTLREAGTELNMHYANVRKSKNRALIKMKKELRNIA